MQVSRDKKFIFTGKNRLRVLQKDSNSKNYLILNSGSEIEPFIDIKLLNTGELLVFEENSSDLVKYSKKLHEISRINGIKPINLKGAEMVSTLHTGDEFMYIWMPGDSSIGLVHPDTMIHDLVTNFYGAGSERISPFTVIGHHREKKVLGLYIKENGEVWFTFLRAGQGLVRKSQKEVLENGKVISLID